MPDDDELANDTDKDKLALVNHDDDDDDDEEELDQEDENDQIVKADWSRLANVSHIKGMYGPPIKSFSGVNLQSFKAKNRKAKRDGPPRRKQRNSGGKRKESLESWQAALGGFYPVVSPGTREMAFVHAISSAGVAHALTRACSSGELENCGCDRSLRGMSPEGFQVSDKIRTFVLKQLFKHSLFTVVRLFRQRGLRHHLFQDFRGC